MQSEYRQRMCIMTLPDRLLLELLESAREIEPFVGDIKYMGDRQKREDICSRFSAAVEALSNKESDNG